VNTSLYKPLTITLDSRLGYIVRSIGIAQNATFTSVIRASIMAMSDNGAPVILDPWGGEGDGSDKANTSLD